MRNFFDLTPDQQAQRLQQVGTKALGHWGLDDCQLRLIKYRENAVFEVRCGGQKFALRLHRFGYHSDAELHSELLWMQALAESGIQVPVVIPTLDGRNFITLSLEGLPCALQIDLFEWIAGRQLGAVEAGINNVDSVPHVYHTMGELAARVHNQSSSWQLPKGFVRHAWDCDGLVGETPFWGRFWELEAASAAQRKLLIAGKRKVHEALTALDRSAPVYGLIHADFAPENFMVDEQGIRLIDFDDAGFGWYMFELATSLYFILEEPYYPAARDALIRGYRCHRELPDAQLDLMPLFLTARGFTYLGWVHTRQETQTAQEFTPFLLQSACRQTESYLAGC